VLVGLEKPDDAGVYRLSDDIALVETVDFFTPIVDDPELFGRIAAANSLSDVWAMGARAVSAVNVVCFPSGKMDIEVLRRVLAGGLETLREAGVALLGGHSVDDPELKYGLAVTGVVHPDRFVKNSGARAGDRLVLTKPLGTGIVATGIKGAAAAEESVAAAVASMTALNRRPAELMLEHGARAATDVTGFGLVGHASEMVEEGDVGLAIDSGSVPLLTGARELAAMGMLAAGLHRNREFYACRVTIDPDVQQPVADLLHDPQTSGGLLVALAPDAAEEFVMALTAGGSPEARVIGEFTDRDPGKIVVRA
jgi:selenide,water dikinase